MRWLRIALVLLAVLLVESTFLSRPEWTYLRPDLFLLLVLFLALKSPTKSGYVLYWLIGLAKDVFSLDRLGVQALLLMVVGLAAETVRGKTFSDHWLTQIILTFILCTGLGVAGALIGAGLHGLDWPILSSAGVTAVLSPFALWLLAKLIRKQQAES